MEAHTCTPWLIVVLEESFIHSAAATSIQVGIKGKFDNHIAIVSASRRKLPYHLIELLRLNMYIKWKISKFDYTANLITSSLFFWLFSCFFSLKIVSSSYCCWFAPWIEERGWSSKKAVQRWIRHSDHRTRLVSCFVEQVEPFLLSPNIFIIIIIFMCSAGFWFVYLLSKFEV
jgi:hypothetical protein